MPTLTGIYTQLTSGTPATLLNGPFQEPGAGPTARTGRSLLDIIGVLPQINANGAPPGDVLSGNAFWGLTAGQWGLRTGTMPNNGSPTYTPTKT